MRLKQHNRILNDINRTYLSFRVNGNKVFMIVMGIKFALPVFVMMRAEVRLRWQRNIQDVRFRLARLLGTFPNKIVLCRRLSQTLSSEQPFCPSKFSVVPS